MAALLVALVAAWMVIGPALRPRLGEVAVGNQVASAEEALDYYIEHIEAPPEGSAVLSQLEMEMLASINTYRDQAGLPPTAGDALLTNLARFRSQDMATRNYFSHTTPEGTTAFTLLQANGLGGLPAGEIVGRTNGPTDQSVKMVMNGFMHSPSHRDNVLCRSFTRAGVGSATGPGGIKYYTVIFLGD